MNAKQKQVEELRYERKFAVEIEDIKSFLYVVKLHPALFTETYEERRVNSLYFDTDDYSYYQDTTLGKSDRLKVRLRWYGNDIETISDGKVEIKSKSGYLGSKDTFNLGSFPTDEFLTNYKEYVNSAEDLDTACKQLFRFLRPILIVSYLRRYFISADKRFRITLDYALGFYDVQSGFNPLKKVSSNVTVLELKYQYEHDELARTLTGSIPNRYSKSSKYRIGLESL
jgi:VTC domain